MYRKAMVRGQNGQVNEIRGLALWQRIIGETSRSHSQPKRNPQLEQTRVAAMRGEAYALAGDKTRARQILREMQVHANREHVPSRSWRQQSQSVPPLPLAIHAVPNGEKAIEALVLADDLVKRFPRDTIVTAVWLPTIHAQIETGRKNAARSIELLQTAAPDELGMLSASASNSCLYPVYVRAEAYLSAQQGQAAAAEFQKILDHRGLLWNCATGALADRGLARAYVLQGDTAKARAAYQDFLALWKDADPDITILKEAKAEYAKLQ
jgi:predicted Zn-dependent protease